MGGGGGRHGRRGRPGGGGGGGGAGVWGGRPPPPLPYGGGGGGAPRQDGRPPQGGGSHKGGRERRHWSRSGPRPSRHDGRLQGGHRVPRGTHAVCSGERDDDGGARLREEGGVGKAGGVGPTTAISSPQRVRSGRGRGGRGKATSVKSRRREGGGREGGVRTGHLARPSQPGAGLVGRRPDRQRIYEQGTPPPHLGLAPAASRRSGTGQQARRGSSSPPRKRGGWQLNGVSGGGLGGECPHALGRQWATFSEGGAGNRRVNLCRRLAAGRRAGGGRDEEAVGGGGGTPS